MSLFADAFAFQHSVLKQQGKYPHTITIEQPPTAVDAFGHRTGNWTVFAPDLPASVVTQAGSERTDNQQTQAEVSHVVYLDFLPGVTAAMRVNFAGRFLQIASAVNVGERSIELELHCTEKL